MQKVLVAVLVLICVSFAGCMSFQSNNARQFANFPPTTIQPRQDKIKIALQVKYQVVGMMATNDRRQSAVDNIAGWAENNLVTTGIFAVVPETSPTDYKLSIRVRDDAHPNLGFAFLTGLTLYLIPSYSEDVYTTDVELIDANGKNVVSKTFNHNLTMYQQLLLIFGSPFATLSSTEKAMWQDILRDVTVLVAENVRN